MTDVINEARALVIQLDCAIPLGVTMSDVARTVRAVIADLERTREELRKAEAGWDEARALLATHEEALDARQIECDQLRGDLDAARAELADLRARGVVPDADCRCGSGGHPRRCEKHPHRFEMHVREINEAADLEAARAELVRVTAERDAAQASAKHWKYHADKWAAVRDRQIEYRDAAIRRADAAESALAAAQEALPTEVERRSCVSCFTSTQQGLIARDARIGFDWLSRLDAYHAAHPAASALAAVHASGVVSVPTAERWPTRPVTDAEIATAYAMRAAAYAAAAPDLPEPLVAAHLDCPATTSRDGVPSSRGDIVGPSSDEEFLAQVDAVLAEPEMQELLAMDRAEAPGATSSSTTGPTRSASARGPTRLADE